ncbi:hypothetical protein OH76DRAFT_1405415 [Lentinus brumalis]|uniref:Uncharacterized protein n=1 Tax=Lentinus brumalis TaxID=2498619 RepID=A0A371D5R9_9APHY|nr:hypothetical protein OH76DRAFT_1405415 [Polyporus brumalis]
MSQKRIQGTHGHCPVFSFSLAFGFHILALDMASGLGQHMSEANLQYYEKLSKDLSAQVAALTTQEYIAQLQGCIERSKTPPRAADSQDQTASTPSTEEVAVPKVPRSNDAQDSPTQTRTRTRPSARLRPSIMFNPYAGSRLATKHQA